MMYQLLRQLPLCMGPCLVEAQRSFHWKEEHGKHQSHLRSNELRFASLPQDISPDLHVYNSTCLVLSCQKQSTLPEVPISPKAIWIVGFDALQYMISVNITEQCKQS